MLSLSSWMKIRLNVSGVSSLPAHPPQDLDPQSSTLFSVTVPPARGHSRHSARSPDHMVHGAAGALNTRAQGFRGGAVLTD